MADHQQEHPIFDDIRRGDLEAVQQRVRADAAVLEQGESGDRRTPLMEAICMDKPAIALWLIEHRGQQHVNTAEDDGWTVLHYASTGGLLEVVQALVAAGVCPAAVSSEDGVTPLIISENGHTDILAFLLQRPAVNASFNGIDQGQWTALSYASAYGRQPIVELLLDAGADPSIPSGHDSPLHQAVTENHHAIAALLRHVIDEAERFHALHKVRSLLGGGPAALACLEARLEQGQAPPRVELTTARKQQQLLQQQQHEKLRATAAFAVGVSGGEKDSGLCEELYMELLGYMLPVWADKGPEA